MEPYEEGDETIFVGRNSNLFDRVYIGCSVTQLLTKGLLACLKRAQVQVFVETSLYLLHMADVIHVKFKQYLAKIARVSVQKCLK